ncbi:hypothetical protein EDD86DRAFT_244278 [Gorgonomyces haynaldii]|nr:hypothetical protein EDD86DRAFT_244278 [Gorgonomyces haynaldii]
MNETSLFLVLLLTHDIAWLIVNALLLFVYRNTETIQRRNPTLVCLIAISHLVFFHGVLFGYTGVSQVTETFVTPWLVHILTAWGSGVFLLSYTIMSLSLIVTHLLTMMRLKLETKDVEKQPELEPTQLFLIKVFQILKHDPFEKRDKSIENSENQLNKTGGSSVSSNIRGSIASSNTIQVMNGRISDRIIFLHCTAIIILVTSLSAISVYLWFPIANSQYTSTAFKAVLIGVGLSVCVVHASMLYALRHFKDSLGVKYELAAFNAAFIPLIITFAVLELAPGVRDLPFVLENGTMIPVLIECVCTFVTTNGILLVYSISETRRNAKLLPWQARRTTMTSRPSQMINKPASGMDDLIEIILNPETFVRLKKNLAEDLCPENAMFLDDLMQGLVKLRKPLLLADHPPLDVTKHLSRQSSMDNVPESEIKDMREINEQVFLKYLHKKYIKPDAPNELNIPSKIRKEIHQKLFVEKDPNLTIALYDKTRDEVLKMIYTNNYSRLKRSLDRERS